MQLPQGEYPAETASSLVEKYFLFSSFVFLAEAQEDLWNTCDFLLPTKLPLFLFDGNFVGHTACRGRGITGRRAVAVYAVIGRVAYAYVGMGIITAPGIAGAKRY